MQPSNTAAAAAERSTLPPASIASRHRLHGATQLALVRAAGAAVKVGVGEAIRLHVRDQLASPFQLHRGQPGTQQLAGVGRCEITAGRPVTGVAFAQQALRHAHHHAGSGPCPVPAHPRRLPASGRRARSRRAPTWRRCPDRRAHVSARRADGPAAPRASRAGGVSVNVRPMSTPAWSSLPPIPFPSWVAM